MAQASSAGEWQDSRGRQAERPRHITAAGWKDVAWRVKDQIARDRLSIVAAGVAFYALLAVFPALAALISIYGLMFDPQQVTEQIQALEGLLPRAALEVLTGELQGLSGGDSRALGFGLVFGLLLALWSASKGIKTLMEALNVAYDEREKRGFIKLNATALLLTLGAIAGAILAIGAVVALPALIRFLGLRNELQGLMSYARWPILAAAVAIGFALLYRYGPSRERPRWVWVSWGALIGTALWLAGSAAFSWYVSSFGNFNQTYGSVGAIVILLTWFLLSAYAVLIGAEINAELERRARPDRSPA